MSEPRHSETITKSKADVKRTEKSIFELTKIIIDTTGLIKSLASGKRNVTINNILNNMSTIQEEVISMHAKVQNLESEYTDMENELLKDVYQLQKELSTRQTASESHIPSGVYIYPRVSIHSEFDSPFTGSWK